MASSYLTRSAQTATSNTTMTISVWFKRNKLGSGTIWMHENNASHNAKLLLFFSGTNDQISMQSYNGSAEYTLTPTRKFMDLNAWYHVTAVWNTTVSTTADRMQIWINGVRETSFSTSNYPSQNHEIDLSNKAHQIGRYGSSSGFSNYWDGSMSQFILVDGQAYNASKFGLVDSDTGEWKANASPTGITYGNRGVWLKMEDSSNLGLDSSGKNNNYTSSGIVRTPSCPNNVFATLNPLHIQGNTNRAITYGNTRFYTTSNAWGSMLSTLGFSSGKFYVEAKILGLDSSTGYGSIAIQDINAFGSSGNTDADLKGNTASAGLGIDYRSGESSLKSSNVTVSSNVGNFSDNDIIGMAIDMDNKALYIHKGGTYYQIGGVTGVPTSGASKTGAITIPTSIETCAIGMGGYSGNADFCYNFGNGYFTSTAVASAGTNASGNGIFEYDVPTGYTALSTKGLNI